MRHVRNSSQDVFRKLKNERVRENRSESSCVIGSFNLRFNFPTTTTSLLSDDNLSRIQRMF